MKKPGSQPAGRCLVRLSRCPLYLRVACSPRQQSALAPSVSPGTEGAWAALQLANDFCGTSCLSDYGSLRLRRRLAWELPRSPAESGDSMRVYPDSLVRSTGLVHAAAWAPCKSPSPHGLGLKWALGWCRKKCGGITTVPGFLSHCWVGSTRNSVCVAAKEVWFW